MDLSMTWRICSDVSAAAAAGSALAGILTLVSSHLLYELPGIRVSPFVFPSWNNPRSRRKFAVFRTAADGRTDRQTIRDPGENLLSSGPQQTDGQTDRRTDRQTNQGARNVFKFKLRRHLATLVVFFLRCNGIQKGSKFFLVGVTNLAPGLALIKYKIRLNSSSMFESYFPTNCFFCLFL